MQELTRTIPASWYYDPKVYEIERKAIFGSEWLYAAEEQSLKKQGDYITLELAGYPILLIVGSDLKVRAFHNVCRHRAAPLLTETKGSVKSPTLSCRYHGWTYDLTGKFINAPLFEACKVQNSQDLSLYEIQVGIFNGLVFINLDKNAQSLSVAFLPILGEIQKSNYSMADYTFHSSMSQEGQFNWKVWVDGYQECYHCMTIHPVFNKDFALRRYQIENKDGYSVHSCERKSESGMGGFEGLWLWIYPNLGLPCYEPCFYTLQVNPLGPNRTRLTYHFRFKESVSEEIKNEFITMVRGITMEDVTVCEQVQKNLEAGVYQQGILNPARENGVEYFHSLVRRANSNHLAAPIPAPIAVCQE